MINKAGLDLVKTFEGYSDEAYLCPAGVPTIGYGFTTNVKMGDCITREEADARLLEELREFADDVMGALKAQPTANQFAAMTSLAYNIGPTAFCKSTVLRMHNLGEFEEAARAFSMWNKAGGKILNGLVRRRAAEAALYLKPDEA
jgi:lysozyme